MISCDFDMRGNFGPVRDQGKRQTCMAFAASDAHAFVHSRPAAELSVEFAHYSACRRMPQFLPHVGTTGAAMLEAMAVDGQPPEAEWPYLGALPPDLSDYKPPRKLLGLVWHRGEPLNALQEADTAIRGYWPVILGLSLSISFYKLAASTVLRGDSDLSSIGRHAVLAVGMFSEGKGDNGYIIRNSWGKKWADSGYGFISRDYIEPRVLFAGVFRG